METSHRLKRVRENLGLNLREMATELQVTHGAIALWENGDRPIPGPVLRLLELYEEQLGIKIESSGDLEELDEIVSNRWIRRAKISKATGEVCLNWLGVALRSALASQAEISGIKRKVYVRLAQKLVRDLGQMKGLPMKMGQMMSYLAFSMPDEAREILAQLQNGVAPLSNERISHIIQAELGGQPREIFAKWSSRPLAMASIGQVHLARLKTGETVAVKVQYPGIAEAITSDAQAMSALGPLLKFFLRESNPGDLQKEMTERFLQECDFEKEAENQELFRRLYQGRKEVLIPRAMREYSTRKVLCTEYHAALSFREFATSATQDERNRAGETIFRFSMESVFRHHIFNADPHPGNYLFDGDRVVFLDFGCVRHFATEFIDSYKTTVQGVIENDQKKILEGLQRLGVINSTQELDLDHITRFMRAVFEPCLRDEPYSYRNSYVKNAFQIWFIHNTNRNRMFFGREWLFLSRLIWGTAAVLAELGVTANVHRQILPLIYQDQSERPVAPFLPGKRLSDT